jgi:hypothetical protein
LIGEQLLRLNDKSMSHYFFRVLVPAGIYVVLGLNISQVRPRFGRLLSESAAP